MSIIVNCKLIASIPISHEVTFAFPKLICLATLRKSSKIQKRKKKEKKKKLKELPLPLRPEKSSDIDTFYMRARLNTVLHMPYTYNIVYIIV